jgi:creatine kinase
MSNAQHDDLIQRQILFPDPDDFAIAAGLARDWPDARGIYCDDWSDTPGIMIWCNAEDHFWIVSTSKGGDVQNVFTRLTQAIWALETSLGDRGHRFEEDRRLGFLNTSPANIGTGLRASVFLKLVRLGQHPGFFEFIEKLRLEANVEYEGTDKHYTGIFNIANAEALGKGEVTLINIMIQGVGQLIELEKKLENGEKVDLSAVEVEPLVEEKK